MEKCMDFPLVTETGRNVKVEIGGRKRKVKLFCQRMWERLFGPLPQGKSLEKKIVQNADFSNQSQRSDWFQLRI